MGANATKAARHVLSTRPHVLKNDLRDLFAHAAESNAHRQAQASRFRSRNSRGKNQDGEAAACVAVDDDERRCEQHPSEIAHGDGNSCDKAGCRSADGARSRGRMEGSAESIMGPSARGASSNARCAENCGQGCGEAFPVDRIPSSSTSASASPIIPMSAPIFRQSVPPAYATSSRSSPCSLSLSCCDEGYGLSSTRDSSDAFDVAGASGELNGGGEVFWDRPQTPLLLLEWQEKVVGEMDDAEDEERRVAATVDGDRGGEVGEIEVDCYARNLRVGGRFRSDSSEDEEDDAFRKEGFIVRRRRRNSADQSVSTSSVSGKKYCCGNPEPQAGCVNGCSQLAGEVGLEVGEEFDAGVGGLLGIGNLVAATSGSDATSCRIGRSGSRNRRGSQDRSSHSSHDDNQSVENDGNEPTSAASAVLFPATDASTASDAGASAVVDVLSENATCEPVAWDCAAAERMESSLKAVGVSSRSSVLKGLGGRRERGGRAFWSGHLDVKAASSGTIWSNVTSWRPAAVAVAGKEAEQAREAGIGNETGKMRSSLHGCPSDTSVGHRRLGSSKHSSSSSSKHEWALLAAVERLVWHRLRTESDEPVLPELFYRVHTTEKSCREKTPNSET
ncbi:unnamed protein product [Closterium sp. NIES-53]